jgi:hypothetical protein
MNKKFKNVPSKRGKRSSHCSLMTRITKKVKELSILFSELEKCATCFYRFLVIVWKIALFIIFWLVLFLRHYFLSAL